jgi:hypothetical protein
VSEVLGKIKPGMSRREAEKVRPKQWKTWKRSH